MAVRGRKIIRGRFGASASGVLTRKMVLMLLAKVFRGSKPKEKAPGRGLWLLAVRQRPVGRPGCCLLRYCFCAYWLLVLLPPLRSSKSRGVLPTPSAVCQPTASSPPPSASSSHPAGRRSVCCRLLPNPQTAPAVPKLWPLKTHCPCVKSGQGATTAPGGVRAPPFVPGQWACIWPAVRPRSP